VKILMDESGNGNGSQPLIVGAVELGDDADDVEQLVRDLYKRLGTRRDLAGMPGFEEFRENGFHSATDPVEVSVPFLELIRSLIFRAYMVVTDRTRVPGRTELQRIEYMYVKLLSDLLIRYRNDESELICCIEHNQGLGPIVDRLPDTATKRAYATLGKVAQLPELKISIVTKTECMSAAIVDYVMSAVTRWIQDGSPEDAGKRSTRGFRQIEPFISVLYSFEHGRLASRKEPLH
jgi:hypothetical protein